MKTTAVPLLSILTAALLLTACASDHDGWWGHRRDHDGDHNHLVGAQAQPGGATAPVFVNS